MNGLDLNAALGFQIVAVLGAGLVFALVITAIAEWLDRRVEPSSGPDRTLEWMTLGTLVLILLMIGGLAYLMHGG